MTNIKSKLSTSTVVKTIAVCMALFQLYSSVRTVDTYILRSTHLSFALILVFLIRKPNKEKRENNPVELVDLILVALSFLCLLYPIVNFDRLVNRWPYVSAITTGDIVYGICVFLLVIEASRRVVGLIMPVIGIVSVLYVYFGQMMPDAIQHRGFSGKWIIDHMALYTEGIFGMPLGVSATFAFLFILFGSILSECGAAPYFFDLSQAFFGKQKGGTGKVAVLASGLMGTVTGSAPGNVFATGTLTIPMMKKSGFKSEFAGGIEAAASTGGQIMPPVMGSAAFLLAEFVGIPYTNVVIMAIIPAIFYYISVFTSVHLYSVKNDLRGQDKVPSIKEILKKGYYLMPIVVLVSVLALGYSATRACLISLVSVTLVPLFTEGPKETIKILLKAMSNASKNAVSLAISCAIAGIFIGALSITGLGFKLTMVLINLAGGNPWLLLFFAMVAIILMGMGMPTPPAYAFAAALAVPAIIEVGFHPIASHFFAFYIACFSSITPPVALASYAAASIAETDFFKTGIQGFLIGAAGLIIPFQFLTEPQLLLLDVESIAYLVRIIIGSVIGIVMLNTSIQGWMFKRMSTIERVLAFISAFALIDTGMSTDIAGIILISIIVFIQLKSRSKSKSDYSNVE